MSVINRIEVCNFLNLDNRKPSDSEWRPHWRHALLNLRGQSTAIVATNGVGKSTLNRAIYAILTRDRHFTAETRKRAAPKRQGLYSHVRLELLYRSNSDIVAPGLFGSEVPGEAYVFGCYGFADGDEGLLFYAYRGRLEDCPVVHIEGHRKTPITNLKFREQLVEQPSLCESPPAQREDWLVQIQRHFDPSVLHQLVLYQKAGGGDGAEHFFKVQRGAGEDYDSAFFYAHIAPEILVHCMDMYGEEGEYRFEDTMLESARPIIHAEQKCENKREELNRLQSVFSGIQRAHQKVRDYREAQLQLARTAGAFLTEAHFLRDIVETAPIVGVPAAATEQHPPAVASVANRMVLHESGDWLIPDRVLSEILGSEPKAVNREASDKQATGQALRANQVLETPGHRGIAQRPQGGGPASIGYGRAATLLILQRRQRFADGWDAESAQQAINSAFNWREGNGDSNPLHRHRRALEVQRRDVEARLAEDRQAMDAAAKEREQLLTRIQALKAAEHELLRMRKSGLFSAKELAVPAKVQEIVDRELATARGSRETHERHHIELKHGRSAYQACSKEYGAEPPPRVLDRLTKAMEESARTLSAAQDVVRTLDARAKQTEHDWTQACEKLGDLQTSHQALTYLLPKAEAFEHAFPGEHPDGLATRVQAEERTATERFQQLLSEHRQLQKEFDTLSAFGSTVERYVAQFTDEDPRLLVERVVQDYAQAQEQERELKRTLKANRESLTALQAGQASLAAVRTRFGATADISRLERHIQESLQSRTADRVSMLKEVEQLTPMARVLQQFAKHFGTDADSALVMRERQEQLDLVTRKIDRFNETLSDLRRQQRELRGANATAGRIASQVLNALELTKYLRVHELISELSLPADRRALVFTHFSHVLHAPVVEDLESADRALSALERAGLEAPVFLKGGLVEFCRTGKLSEQRGLVHSFMVGSGTMQVRALIDPRDIDALRKRVEAELAEVSGTLSVLQDEYNDLLPESEKSAMVRGAVEATKQNAVVRLIQAQAKLEQLEQQLVQCREDASDVVLGNVRTAVWYQEAGGDQELTSKREALKETETELEAAVARLPQLAHRASDESLTLIKAMCRFLDRGGPDRLKAVKAELARNISDTKQLESDLPRLRQRATQIGLIEEAAEFIRLGGHEVLAGAVANLEQAAARVAEAERARNEVAALLEEASSAVASAMQNKETSFARFHEWRERLLAAREYLDAGGLSFDETYQQRLAQLKDSESRADKRSRFNFPLAQEGFDAEVQSKNRPSLHDQLAQLSQHITRLEAQIKDKEHERDRKQEQGQVLSQTARRLDQAVSSIIQQWLYARDILQEIPPELIATAERAGESTSLSAARGLAQQLRAPVDINVPGRLADLADDLAANTAAFPLNTHGDTLRSQRQDVARTLRELRNEVQVVKSAHDDELSVAEREGLVPDQDPQRLTACVDALYSHFESYLLEAERQHEHFQQDLETAKAQLVKSVEGFTASVEDNYRLLKRTIRYQEGQGAGLEVDAGIVERGGIRAEIDKVISNIRTAERRRAEDASLNKPQESQAEFDARLKREMRESFYRGIFRAPKDSNASGPIIHVRHPEIAGGRALRLTEELSTGQANALALLILTKLADFALHRDAHADVLGIGNRRAKPSSTRVILIDGLFSNLSDRRMIRNSLSVIKALKGQFQLIGFIHSVVYENDPELFPSYIALRRVNKEHGFVLVENGNPVDRDSGQVAIIDFHADRTGDNKQKESHDGNARDDSGADPAAPDGRGQVAATDRSH
jgi:hypothetical protein